MTTLEGSVAAVTGAASGIGRSIAVALAKQHCAVALSDVDEVGLSRTAQLCTAHRVEVSQHVVDVADRDAVFAWADAVSDSHGAVHLLFNNAGVNLTAPAEVQSVADVGWLMDVDFWGVVHGTQAFLPHIRQSGFGHIVNISSVFGLVSIPSQSAYNAAKFAVRGYSDALRMELELEGCGIRVTTVHPGGVKTNIVRNSRSDDLERAIERFDQLARTEPDAAAEQILRAVRRDRRRALIGPDAVLYDLVSRLPASLSQRIVMGVVRRQARQ